MPITSRNIMIIQVYEEHNLVIGFACHTRTCQYLNCLTKVSTHAQELEKKDEAAWHLQNQNVDQQNGPLFHVLLVTGDCKIEGLAFQVRTGRNSVSLRRCKGLNFCEFQDWRCL